MKKTLLKQYIDKALFLFHWCQWKGKKRYKNNAFICVYVCVSIQGNVGSRKAFTQGVFDIE